MEYLPQGKIKQYREKHKPANCPILGIKTNDWVVDHDHQSGMVRGVISRQGNSLIGKIENFYLGMCKGNKELLPRTLRSIATYLESDVTQVLHYVGLNQLRNKFKNKLTSAQQYQTLVDMGAGQDELDQCSNQKHRAELFRKLTKIQHER
jgi:hypothetical protein